MTSITEIFRVSNSQYHLLEMNCADTITPDMYQGFNGLISAHEFIAIIMTGTETGSVSVTADWRETEPPLDLDHWDEVVEVSMAFEEEPGCLISPMNDSDGRSISHLPPGSYRVRVHARGRDQGLEVRTVEGAAVEEHLIQAWPAPVGPEVRHKLTDQYGAMLRAL